MQPIPTAITLLQLAREQLDTELHHRGAHYEETMSPDNEDLSDVIDDLGVLLSTLESFGGNT